LVAVNGLGVLVPVGIPLLISAFVWFTLHRKCSRGGPIAGYLAWMSVTVLAAGCLVASLIGLFTRVLSRSALDSLHRARPCAGPLVLGCLSTVAQRYGGRNRRYGEKEPSVRHTPQVRTFAAKQRVCAVSCSCFRGARTTRARPVAFRQFCRRQGDETGEVAVREYDSPLT
jgi:hypothetical protein